MVEEDYAAAGPPPKMFEGWKVRHLWGTSWVDVTFEKDGFDVTVESHFRNRRRLPTPIRNQPKNGLRVMGLADNQELVTPMGYADSKLLTITIKNTLNWHMKITSWVRDGVLILRDLVTYKDVVPTTQGAEGYRRYKGPGLTEFDLVWGLFGGRGFAWDPTAGVLDKPPPVEDAEDEGKEALMKATEDALRRSIYRNMTAADVAKDRRQLPLQQPQLPPLLAPYHRFVTLPSHDPFVTLSPAATDALYNFLDHLGVNDPNLLVVEDMTAYIESLEAIRATHALFDVFEA
eukprot:TRINITY_DN2203_c2_g1_i1.p1 TRINITY_DN2203_c2_g1~~TRINITY_DN2203_c2_g1_i1.p1  ORF type:complete len:336 (+),score=51.71 TRINITY_DN2203_c2_g1_i1:142-1008(+)